MHVKKVYISIYFYNLYPSLIEETARSIQKLKIFLIDSIPKQVKTYHFKIIIKYA